MPNPLSNSYDQCAVIAKNSGSSFYRSFSLLGQERRNAMMALYAFARLADDATDATKVGTAPRSSWSAQAWHYWLDSLHADKFQNTGASECLAPVRLALADAVRKFSIPMETLHDIVRGVDSDVSQALSSDRQLDSNSQTTHSTIRMLTWEDTVTYCHRVASSVGLACLSIWAKEIGTAPNQTTYQAALDCGVAFQMTNILRDIVEDSQRNRIYLPNDELERFGIDDEKWIKLNAEPTTFAINEVGDWRGLLRLQLERTKAMYENGWRVAESISLDGKRMFSLMWHSYRRLLARIEESPESIWQSRIQLTKLEKTMLVCQHLFTPSFTKLMASKQTTLESDPKSERRTWPKNGPRVAVIGAGLAGISSAMHLARHGCQVTLYESKNRIGGRVGSFVDTESGQSIDYCQHVGMNCCSTLKQWIEDTNQEPYWTEQDSLHFVAANGKRIQVVAWPLPAPFHLAGLLFRWPQLNLMDRVRVGGALLRLMRLKRSQIASSQLAIDWLKANGQNDRCIQSFWGTILVSALGEQIDRVTLEATHKVLIVGFAAQRRAFHLLVPNRPLSELLDQCVSKKLVELAVDINLGRTVKSISKDDSGAFHLSFQPDAAQQQEPYHAIVSAVPWNKLKVVLPEGYTAQSNLASGLQSSPITGIHTWWDRPWLKEPHAILINRFCQWVFPAPVPLSHNAKGHSLDSTQNEEFYYQIVISASRDLPTGNPEGILKMVKADLSEAFPEASVATMLRGRVVTDPNAVFSVSPGHETSRLDGKVLNDTNIWLAGDWTATQWPATMEGALRSGGLAAQDLLHQFGRTACIIEDVD